VVHRRESAPNNKTTTTATATTSPRQLLDASGNLWCQLGAAQVPTQDKAAQKHKQTQMLFNGCFVIGLFSVVSLIGLLTPWVFIHSDFTTKPATVTINHSKQETTVSSLLVAMLLVYYIRVLLAALKQDTKKSAS
jgi:hypothetical protein